MSDTKKYRPAAHAVGMLSHLTGRPVAPEGEPFELDRTIRRRLADGDLVEVIEQPEAKPRQRNQTPATSE